MRNPLEKSSVAQSLDGGPSDGESACPRLPNIRPSLVPRQGPWNKKRPLVSVGMCIAATSHCNFSRTGLDLHPPATGGQAGLYAPCDWLGCSYIISPRGHAGSPSDSPPSKLCAALDLSRRLRVDEHGFHFGLEAEFLLVEAGSCRPLWHPQLRFDELNAALEAIPVDDFPCDGLDVEPLHRNPIPFVVEGYHLPDPNLKPVDLLPKGIEIRTPVCSSIEECLGMLEVLHERMQRALLNRGYRAVILSFHPTEDHFEGPQNKRRYDHWQWAMEAMTTYGPDVNVSLPPHLADQLDLHELNGRVNYYAPALTALSLASPLYRCDLWRIRG